ncbi:MULTISPECIES: VanZ family protein [Streptomyces violaceusniger group]|uniref:VanZ family protein n=1 Tax=Streptomyces antimycoticus TaxID=68175 RepID=A0ABD5J672_9ACTN|nr:VanZ family protein [Streptomyces violaceusniger]MEE4583868.1 VanZ family protein [Streptomyces sp. DSM 41602]
MISIAGWEIRRTADKRTTVKRTAEKRSGEKKQPGERKPGEKRSGEKKPGERKPRAGSRTTGGQKPASGERRASGQKKGPRAGGAPTKGSRTAQPQATKSQTAKAESAKASSTKARTAKPAKPTEPEGTRETALLQRKSFGARAARLLVLLVAFVCMVGFAAALAKATLVPQPGSVDLVHTNLHPGRSLRAYIDQPAFRDTVKQIGGNVLLGAPFGVLLPMLLPKARGAVRVVVVTALVMVAVETVQGLIVEGRAFDIDDVILNTTGALLGYVVVGRWLGHALHPRRRHWWHRWTRRGTEVPPAA